MAAVAAEPGAAAASTTTAGDGAEPEPEIVQPALAQAPLEAEASEERAPGMNLALLPEDGDAAQECSPVTAEAQGRPDREAAGKALAALAGGEQNETGRLGAGEAGAGPASTDPEPDPESAGDPGSDAESGESGSAPSVEAADEAAVVGHDPVRAPASPVADSAPRLHPDPTDLRAPGQQRDAEPPESEPEPKPTGAGGDSVLIRPECLAHLIPGSEVRVSLDHIIDDALVVSFRLGEKIFSGVLMDLSKRQFGGSKERFGVLRFIWSWRVKLACLGKREMVLLQDTFPGGVCQAYAKLDPQSRKQPEVVVEYGSRGQEVNFKERRPSGGPDDDRSRRGSKIESGTRLVHGAVLQDQRGPAAMAETAGCPWALVLQRDLQQGIKEGTKFGPYGIPVTVFPKRDYRDKPEPMQLKTEPFQPEAPDTQDGPSREPSDAPAAPHPSLWTSKPPPLFQEGAPYPPPLFIRDTYNQPIPQPPPRKIKRPKRKLYREEPTSIMNAIKLRPRQVLCDKCKGAVAGDKREARRGPGADCRGEEAKRRRSPDSSDASVCSVDSADDLKSSNSECSSTETFDFPPPGAFHAPSAPSTSSTAPNTTSSSSSSSTCSSSSASKEDKKLSNSLKATVFSKNVSKCVTPDGRTICVGDIVWAKIYGFPWWPARILAITVSRKDNGLLVRQEARISWFGSPTTSFLALSQLSPFLENFHFLGAGRPRAPATGSALTYSKGAGQPRLSQVCESTRWRLSGGATGRVPSSRWETDVPGSIGPRGGPIDLRSRSPVVPSCGPGEPLSIHIGISFLGLSSDHSGIGANSRSESAALTCGTVLQGPGCRNKACELLPWYCSLCPVDCRIPNLSFLGIWGRLALFDPLPPAPTTLDRSRVVTSVAFNGTEQQWGGQETGECVCGGAERQSAGFRAGRLLCRPASSAVFVAPCLDSRRGGSPRLAGLGTELRESQEMTRLISRVEPLARTSPRAAGACRPLLAHPGSDPPLSALFQRGDTEGLLIGLSHRSTVRVSPVAAAPGSEQNRTRGRTGGRVSQIVPNNQKQKLSPVGQAGDNSIEEKNAGWKPPAGLEFQRRQTDPRERLDGQTRNRTVRAARSGGELARLCLPTPPTLCPHKALHRAVSVCASQAQGRRVKPPAHTLLGTSGEGDNSIEEKNAGWKPPAGLEFQRRQTDPRERLDGQTRNRTVRAAVNQLPAQRG
ncbi:PWP2A protein, partial [Atractosteus spatula]|nr:PWP2A protein [Atractosteus spatula]